MNREGEDLFGAMNTLDNYYLCSYPQFPIKTIDCLILDTMVVNDLYAFVEGGADGQKVTPKVLDLIRKVAINGNAAVMERSWQHQIDTTAPISEYFKPKGADMAERLELLHFIKFSSKQDFESLKRGEVSIADIPKALEFRKGESLAFGFSVESFAAIIAQNWLGIAILLDHERRAPKSDSDQDLSAVTKELVESQIDAYKLWLKDMKARGVGISSELRLMSNLAFFEGHMPGIHGEKVTFAKMAKLDEQSKYSKSRIARNIAFDFQHLKMAREMRMGFINNSLTVDRKFAALLTRDNVLAATVGFVAQEALLRDKGIIAAYKWPIDSTFTVFHQEEHAYSGFYGAPRSSQDLLEAVEVVKQLEEFLPRLDA
jgi:hypothetical protein